MAQTPAPGLLILPELVSPFLQLISTLLLSTTFVQLSDAAEVTLAWETNSQAAGYYIYCGFESGNYQVKIDVGLASQYTIFDLDDLNTYYLAATAYNEYGESDFSEEIIYTPGACDTDIDFDGDTDGSDLALYAEDAMGLDLEMLAARFGGTGCP
jgi:hypothetical protein